MGVVRLAQVVDHAIPHHGDVAVFWNPNNWQSLCKCCHDRKTAGEERLV
jgi:5-methylcytosine-specific restriction protein A